MKTKIELDKAQDLWRWSERDCVQWEWRRNFGIFVIDEEIIRRIEKEENQNFFYYELCTKAFKD